MDNEKQLPPLTAQNSPAGLAAALILPPLAPLLKNNVVILISIKIKREREI